MKRFTGMLGVAVVGVALLACKGSKGSDVGAEVVRYGDKELQVAGPAYISTAVTARSGADGASDAVDMVPAGTPVEKVAEKDDFVLVKWSDDKGSAKQGWVPKVSAQANVEATPKVQPPDEKQQALKGNRLALPVAPVPAPTVSVARPSGWGGPIDEVEDDPPSGWAGPTQVEPDPPSGWGPAEPPEEVEEPSGWGGTPPPPPPPPSGWGGDSTRRGRLGLPSKK